MRDKHDHEDRTTQSNCTEVLAQRRIERTQVSLAAVNWEVGRLAGEEEQRAMFSKSFILEHQVRMERQLGRAYTRSRNFPTLHFATSSFRHSQYLPLSTFCHFSLRHSHFATHISPSTFCRPSFANYILPLLLC